MWETTVKEQLGGVVQNAQNAGKIALDTIMESQKGATVIAAGKAAIIGMPGIPENVKALIGTDGYGDVIVGLIAQTVVDSFTDNPVARELAVAANVYGATIASSKVSIVQDLIKNTILKVAENGTNFVTAIQGGKLG